MLIDLKQLRVQPIPTGEETRYRALMRQHHYLGDLPKIGHTLWYIATFDQQWVARVSFSPTRYVGTVYKAANWHCVGQTQGSRRIRGGYSARDGAPKLVFVRTLQANARFELSRPVMHPNYRQESPKIMQKPERMRALPSYFKTLLTRAAPRDGATRIGKSPDFEDISTPDHGRIESRRIWCSAALNAYLDFPHVGQVFMIERCVFNEKTGAHTVEQALGITSQTPAQADAQGVLVTNRGHWVIENSCHYVIDWNYHEDRSRIRTGHGPSNVPRLRRFAIGVIKTFIKGRESIAEKMRSLNRNTRLVFDYLRMTENSTRRFTPSVG